MEFISFRLGLGFANGRPKLFTITHLVVLAFFGEAFMNQPAMASPKLPDTFVCAWKVQDVEAEILLNGGMIKSGSGVGEGGCSQWVKNGANQLTLRVLSETGPAPLIDFVFKEGNLSDFNNLRQNAELSVGWQKKSGQKFPETIVKTASISHPWGKLLWEQGEILKDDPATRNEAFGALSSLFDAFKRGNIDQVMELIGESANEAGRLFGRPNAKEDTKKVWGKMVGTGLDLGQPQMSDFKFRLCGDDRLIHITKNSGAPAIEIKRKNSTVSLPLYLGKLGKKWRLMSQ